MRLHIQLPFTHTSQNSAFKQSTSSDIVIDTDRVAVQDVYGHWCVCGSLGWSL